MLCESVEVANLGSSHRREHVQRHWPSYLCSRFCHATLPYINTTVTGAVCRHRRRGRGQGEGGVAFVAHALVVFDRLLTLLLFSTLSLPAVQTVCRSYAAEDRDQLDSRGIGVKGSEEEVG